MPEETLRENKMGTMPENKLLLSMAVPMMISMLVQALYNIVDSIFVSRICEDALTAVSMAFPWQNIVIAIAVGFGVGINALLSRALGQKNAERVNQVAVNGLLLAGLSYLLVLVAGLIGIRAYMRTQTDIETIVNYGITYLNICILCSFGVFVEITFERFLQATGRTIYSMITQLTGITPQQLEQEGVEKWEAAAQFAAAISHPNTLLVAYNAQFDLCFLYYFLARLELADALKGVKNFFHFHRIHLFIRRESAQVFSNAQAVQLPLFRQHQTPSD